MRDFTQLRVWEKSHRLTLAVYEVTLALPREEQYGLKSQIRRSCASVPANIAEGCGRGTNAYERLIGEVTEIKRMLTSFTENLRAFADKT